MIGIVVSDKFLIAGVWSDDENGVLTLHNVNRSTTMTLYQVLFIKRESLTPLWELQSEGPLN